MGALQQALLGFRLPNLITWLRPLYSLPLVLVKKIVCVPHPFASASQPALCSLSRGGGVQELLLLLLHLLELPLRQQQQ